MLGFKRVSFPCPEEVWEARSGVENLKIHVINSLGETSQGAATWEIPTKSPVVEVEWLIDTTPGPLPRTSPQDVCCINHSSAAGRVRGSR
jgi:hypothetical protein